MTTLFSILLAFQFSFSDAIHSICRNIENEQIQYKLEDALLQKYESFSFDMLSFTAFKQAYQGYLVLQQKKAIKNEKYLTIVDFTLPSTEKRLFLLDMENDQVVHHTYCAHGKNTGDLYAEKFSNTPGSLQSSLGFYITANTYKGKFDLALRLEGIEPMNDQAMARAVVMHGADYATAQFIERQQRLGRSWGCPAVPMEEAPAIIHRIKDGSCLFIYANDEHYAQQSTVLNEWKAIASIVLKKDGENS
jgi:hypothetical protein